MIVGASHMNNKVVVWITNPDNTGEHLEAVLSTDEARVLRNQLDHHLALARIGKPFVKLAGLFA